MRRRLEKELRPLLLPWAIALAATVYLGMGLTVYSGQPQVNILDAPTEVIAALPGMSPNQVSAFLLQRDASPQDAKSLLPAEAQQFATVEGGKAIRVLTRIVFDNGRQQSAEAVIVITEDRERPFAILSWRDDSIGMLADSQQ